MATAFKTLSGFLEAPVINPTDYFVGYSFPPGFDQERRWQWTAIVGQLTADLIGPMTDGQFLIGNSITGGYNKNTIGEGDCIQVLNGSGNVTVGVKDASIDNAKLLPGIDALKIGDGSVSNTEFQCLSSVTSDIQAQINALQFSGAGNQSLTTNGYQKLPGGLILQWGRYVGTLDDTNTTINLPIPFPNALLNVTCSPYGNSNVTGATTVSCHVNLTGSLNSFTLYGNGIGDNPDGYYWQAIGY